MLVDQALLVSQELIRVAVLWHEHWHERLEEASRFVQEEGRWYYLNGNTSEGPLKPGRNDPCPCGSGRKYKACCL